MAKTHLIAFGKELVPCLLEDDPTRDSVIFRATPDDGRFVRFPKLPAEELKVVIAEHNEAQTAVEESEDE